jgi:uncharacterized protein (TIGR02117 family)
MLRRLLLALFVLPALVLLYGVLGLSLGAVPIGGGPLGGGPLGGGPLGDGAAGADRPVEVFVASNGYHASLVLPLRAHGIDWTERHPPGHFAAAAPGVTHIAFGWGDRDFYMETRTLADLRAGTALRAMFARGGTVMHAALWGRPEPGPDVRRIVATRVQYLALADFVRRSFTGAAPRLHPGRGYGPHDAFYEAVGSYSLIETCNEWVSRGLRAAGIRTGLWTPFAHSILWQAEWR